jgi:recombination protein RecA
MAATLTERLLEKFGKQIVLASEEVSSKVDVLPLGWPEIDDVLPDHGMPRGVVEMRSPSVLGGGTAVALAAVRAVHRRDERAWCAWIDPDGTLYSPGVAMAGVDLNRLAVVRSPRKDTLRIAIKLARSQAFDVIVIDVDWAPGAVSSHSHDRSGERFRSRDATLEVFVRKLALLAAEGGSTVLLLTDASVVRASPLPVAMRLELTRTQHAMDVRVGKERHGRVGLAKTVPMGKKPGLELAG